MKELQSDNESAVETLYKLSKRSLMVVIFLSSAIMVALYPRLHVTILLWYIPLITLVVFRLFSVYTFEEKPHIYTHKKWYRQFLILAYMTAIMFASLGFVYIHFLDSYYQIFIIAVTIGLSSGAAFALSADTRLSINYMSILVLPLFITVLFLPDMPLSTILAGTILLYYIAQIVIIYNLHIQNKEVQNLESEHGLLHNFFENAPFAILLYDNNLIVTNCNNKLSAVLNNDKENIIGLKLSDLPDQRVVPIFKNALKDGSATYIGPYVSIYGKHFFMEMKAFSYTDKMTNQTIGIAVIEDKTKEQHALDKLEYMADHDVLTHLLNRRGFKNYMDNLIVDVKHETHYSILFYLDLDHFKSINDSLGHAVGDRVLIAISERLVNTLGNKCMVSRVGGDEFVIMVAHVSQDQALAYQQADEYTNTIQSIFSNPCIINDNYLHVGTSIGIVVLEPKYDNSEEIIRHADLSMYQAKHSTDQVSYYDSSLDVRQKELFNLQQDLVYAASHEQLKLFYQPVVEIKDEKLLSAEVLLRWEHPDKGILGPEVFIPLAIKAGLLSKITWWLVDNVCQQILQWKKDGVWKLNYISINVNSAQLIENNFAKDFFTKLKEYGISAAEIMIEITERSLVDNFLNTQGVINELRSHGVKCAIDDFGTGYSSLSYLKKLSLHTLKIDREFIKDIGSNPKELILLSTILDIGRQFDYNIVIEGIESEQQKRLLYELDENLTYQGYFFSKPISAKEFTKKYMLN